MKGILKYDDAAGWVVEYQHQLTISCTQRKELQLHREDIYLTESLSRNQEVDFYIVEVEKMSGTVQYAKLITESHSDQVIDIMNDEKSLEISDEEIEKASEDNNPIIIRSTAFGTKYEWTPKKERKQFIEGIKWYKEQLNNKQ